MNLGNFSLSLTVKDIKASRAFYEKMGFEVFDGDEAQNWLMLRCGDTKIGLFQGMFESNLITFNPSDVRKIQANLKEQGIEPIKAAEGEEGPAHMVLQDPDGNTILLDQFDKNHPAMKTPQGKIVWHDLTVPNGDAVRDFYATVVGWKAEALPMGDYSDYMMSADSKVVSGICHQRGENANLPSQWMIYISVDNLAEVIEKVKANGGKIIEVRNDSEGKPQMAFIQDPAGAVAGLYAGPSF
jgi:predicted enzyme related to lactoylglutathione lyase